MVAGTLAGCGAGDEATEPADPAPAPPSADQRSPFFAVNGNVLFTQLLEGRAPLLESHLAQIAAAPISSVRASLDWRRVEPTDPGGGAHIYNFSSHDTWVAALAEHDLRWDPTILGFPVPPWATDPDAAAACESRSPPAAVADYAAFAAALAERYGRGGSFWQEHPSLPELPVVQYEIWNEPNYGSFWCPAPDPPAYAELLRGSAAAIRAVDPRARIVLGGLAPFPESDSDAAPAYMSLADFVDALTAADQTVPDYVDAVGIHTYGEDATAAFAAVVVARAAIDQAGFEDKPIVLNEAGWPSQGSQGGFTAVEDEATRAGAIAELTERVFAARDGLDIRQFAPYTWVSESADATDQEHWFGLADPATGAPYEAGAAYRDAVERLSSRP